ncbi:MAG: ribonuclease III [Candidatus Kerfeldbacteria bacterium]|nr:ribonuclease III [Candidatus Kerfeldbacteria bacterium]
MPDLTVFSKLETDLGVTFSRRDLLVQAFTHRSYLNENPGFKLSHNERLEFLGDAVLELIVTEHLYHTFPNPEGDLTNLRASLVNAKTLAEVALSLNFDTYLLLSRGEAKDTNSKARHTILANAVEALIGAIYLDQGMAVVKRFIEQHLLTRLDAIVAGQKYRDPKSTFQEFAQKYVNVTPAYKVLAEWGPDHDKHFRVGVYLGEEEVAVGEGQSKQEAQVAAAAAAITVKGWGG